jgi:hypothetical protein
MRSLFPRHLTPTWCGVMALAALAMAAFAALVHHSIAAADSYDRTLFVIAFASAGACAVLLSVAAPLIARRGGRL